LLIDLLSEFLDLILEATGVEFLSHSAEESASRVNESLEWLLVEVLKLEVSEVQHGVIASFHLVDMVIATLIGNEVSSTINVRKIDTI